MLVWGFVLKHLIIKWKLGESLPLLISPFWEILKDDFAGETWTGRGFNGQLPSFI
jgi:hypothetical protein